MNKNDLNALNAGHVIWRDVLKGVRREAHAKQVIIRPLRKTHCDECTLPFPEGEKVVRFVVANRVYNTRCLDCYIVRPQL